eukprot:Protomagalhaensia_sp_Gyna_25__847@NODE_140_length_4924_cov_10_700307_g110_i0_p1_GENE_NODE_140_length_4924_cov_10_700307_g110_i0NODE_140_length_4924_cov_10_700307_g110_i0_p1_ORF_typecomplete_len571_score76_11Rgp1/PF08737_10/16Rgp1/PF08737_10/0_0048LDB19/PF13002_7/0_015Arrestin_C/PF02752_22/7_7e03Arrestin_C/PF02752_22/0_13NT5C/PF06941_12/0_33_NODE_140_length_4924_cov_10_700307_g110_i02421954
MTTLLAPDDVVRLITRFKDKSRFILPSPPLFPPVPASFLSPSLLKLQRSLGSGAFSAARDPALPAVLLRSDICSKADIDYAIESCDAGFVYVKWACQMHSDTHQSNSDGVSTPRVRMHNFSDFVSKEDYEETVREFETADLTEFFAPLPNALETLQPGLSRAELVQASLASGPPTLVTPWQPKAPAVHSLAQFLQTGQANEDSSQNPFLCSSEIEKDNAHPFTHSKAFNISIGSHYVCQLSVLGGVSADDHLEPLIFPPIRDYSKSPLQSQGACCRLLLQAPEILLFFDFSESLITVAEIGMKLMLVETLMQSPLGVREARVWSAQRDHQRRPSPRAPSKEPPPQTRRYSSPISSAGNGLTTPKHVTAGGKTLIARESEVVYSRTLNILHQSQTPHKIVLPTNLPNSINNDLVSVTYQLDIEFNCVAHNGELLELRADPRPQSPPPSPVMRARSRLTPERRRMQTAVGSRSSSPSSLGGSPGGDDNRKLPGAPFLVINGPLLAKNILKAVWSAQFLYINEGKPPVDLYENVCDERIVTTGMLLDKAECNLKGQCLTRPPLRRLSFARRIF